MKDFKTIDEQLALLRSRGLIIPNEEKARLYLLTNNYYNIVNGYSKYFPRFFVAIHPHLVYPIFRRKNGSPF